MKRIETAYNSIASEWTEAFDRELDNKPMDREMLDEFARLLGHSLPACDIGCGPGNTTSYLADMGMKIFGIDLSEKILEEARSRHTGITFQKGNLLALDLEDNSIAGAVAFYAMIHFTAEQVQTAFREIFRALRPGGIFLFTWHIGENTIHISDFLGKDIDLDFMFFSAEFITGALEQAGFTGIRVTERDPYPDVEYQSRRGYVFGVKPG